MTKRHSTSGVFPEEGGVMVTRTQTRTVRRGPFKVTITVRTTTRRIPITR